MMPPEQGAIPVFGSQETQDEVFVIGGTFVKKAKSHEEINCMDTEGSSSQSPSRTRIRSDSDAWEDELTELYLQSVDSRKGSSPYPGNQTQVAEEMKNRRELYHECSVPITYAGFRAKHKHGNSKEYSHRKTYVDKRWSKILCKNQRDLYLGLKPNGKKGQLDGEVRVVQFTHQYNDYDQEYDDNLYTNPIMMNAVWNSIDGLATAIQKRDSDGRVWMNLRRNYSL